MVPPTGPLNLDVEAISGICGSISIACWVVVFSPQIVENFRRGSADGLSLQFIIVWLVGDVFNILGSVLQGVLPTMIILAIYYTFADLVLLGQCFYYRGFTWRDEVTPPTLRHKPKTPPSSGATITPPVDEYTALLPDGDPGRRERRGSNWSTLSHLSPAVPLVTPTPSPPPQPPTRLQSIAFNSIAVLMVFCAGVAGWYLSQGSPDGPDDGSDGDLAFDTWGQVFGWLCAVLYLGSRLPQLLLNFRRKSTEGVSVLFFLFACLGNLTYVLSILAFEPRCRVPDHCQPGESAHAFWRYILVNLSWLAGSLGTLLLDLGIFAQFFIYSNNPDDLEDQYDENDDYVYEERERHDSRPILERSISNYSR